MSGDAHATRHVLNPAIEDMTRPELLEVQLSRIIAQVRRCAVDVAFYRERWPAEAARIETLDDFRRVIPFTAKADFVHGLPEHTGRLADGTSVFQHHLTSGTTGLGQEAHPISLADHEALAAGWQYQAYWAGIRPGDTICFTWPIGLQTGGLSTPIVAQRLGLVGVQLGPYPSKDKITYLRTFQPQALVASPSYITHLTHLFEQAGVSPREALPTLKALFVAGESYPASWAEAAAANWGCVVSEWYGLMQGAMNQAFSCETGVLHAGNRGSLHGMDHRILGEVLHPGTNEPVEPGSSGEMVLSTLTRDAFPIIRFRTGDRVTVPAEPCPCGRPFSTIEAGTIARYDDMMKIRGQNLWPESVDRVVLSDPRVAEYAGEVSLDATGREDVLLSVEFVDDASDPSGATAELRERVKSATNVGMRVQAAPSGSLPRFEFKARRWTDHRRTDRQVTRYVTDG
ncbi:phenylacetate--CoA ligase family protein [Pseudonocardia sp. GCM10023141]|uniref:phenylacetate--CoA ligase family protein n=1 Tax=Pseudonocardia sp. GCM10023141 TaxID=3252653 RepID=UPI0036066E03